MDFRIFVEPQQGASYDDILPVARRTEELGFDAFFRSDHYVAMGGDGLPGPSDAWITLAGLARDTERVRLGTLVTSATFRRPGPLAIAVANVDAMSGGRVEFGFGAGWFAKEHAAYAIPFPDVAERFDQFAEQLEIIHDLWRTPAGQTYSFEGEHYRLTDSPALPKPAQQRLPIILGGAGRARSAALAARFADEYNVAFNRAKTEVIVGRVRVAADEAGRELVYSAAHTVCLGADEAEFRRRAEAIGRRPDELRASSIAGTPDEVRERVAESAGWGCTRMYLQVLDLADLDHLDLIAETLL